jgi:parvulin-like peptidyl-prolyl isomerase
MRHIRVSLLLPVVVAAAVAAAGCGGGGNSVPSDSVAQVGDVTITQDQYNNLIDRAKQSYKTQGQPFPKESSPDFGRIRDQAVQFLVQRAEFAQQAADMSVTVTDKDVDNRLAQIKKTYFKGSQQAYEKQLKSQHLTEEEVRADLKDQLISQKLFDKVTADVKVPPKDVEKYYNSNKQQYEQAESRTVRHILISVCGPNAPGGVKCRSKAKAKAFAEQLFQELKNGANFAQLAKKYSQDPGSASQGGKLTITRGQTVAPFDQTAFTLGIGTFSAPIETQYGYHIIMPISAVKPASRTPLSQVRQAIEQQLLQQKKQEKMATFVNGLNKKYHPKYADGYAPTSTSTSTTTTGASTVATTAATTTG